MPPNLGSLRYLTFAVVFASQVVVAVRKLVPFTSTVTNFPRWADVSLKVLRVAPVILLHVDGTVVRAAVTARVQAYHWYRRVGVGYPVQVPAAVRVLLTFAMPLTVGLTVAAARASAISTSLPPQEASHPVAVAIRVTAARSLFSANTSLP
jgi:hypothetical protein